VSFEPTLLEDSLDPWLAVETDAGRREAVIRFLMRLCEAEGVQPDAITIAGTHLPAFAHAVSDTGVVVVWVIAASYRQLAVRYLYDTVSGHRYGG
jgi:hypothetical protein